MRTPAGRRAAGCFLVEGPHAVAEAAAAGLLRQIFATATALERVPELADTGAPVVVVAERTLRGLAGASTPPGLIGVARLLARPLPEVLTGRAASGPGEPGELRLVAVAVAVGDPGNAGSLVRAADAAGADLVVFAGEARPDGGTDPGVDPHNDKCVRASAGSVFHLPLATCPEVTEAVRLLTERGLRVFAADAHGGADLDEAQFPAAGGAGRLAGPTAWLFGNEARGLAPSTLELADARWRIPVYGRAESLNLATAAALCLYASVRARRAGEHRGG